MRGIPGWLTRPRLIMVIAAAVAVAVGAGGTALALSASSPSHLAAMSRGGLTRAELKVTSGTAILDVSVGKLGGTLPLLLAGGVSQFLLSLPAGVPAQVTVGGGASFLSLDGQHLTGIAGGTVVTSPGWAAATSRYDIEAISGFSRLAVSRQAASGS